uniref:phosphatase PAP2 family protein n=1 Tax=Pedobacter sp. TaxID=1411316 RepID=UPI003D7FF634
MKAILIATLFLGLTFNGFAQYTDTLITQPKHNGIKTFLPGVIALSYGAIALNDGALKNLDHHIAERRNEQRPNFSTSADDYLRYAPFVALYGMEALGLKSKHAIKEKTALVLISAGFAVGSAKLLKTWSNKERPNQLDHRSFPSGHATIVFAGAELINQEYRDQSPWYGVAAYTVASATSVLRIYNNDHWFSDVVAGAGVGILSTKLAYLVYPGLQKLLVKDKQ